MIGQDGTIYALSISTSGSFLYAINPGGTLKWQVDLGNNISSSTPVIAFDGTLYFSMNYQDLYAINSSGEILWKFTALDLNDSPNIGNDGTIYIGSDYGLYAINTDGTLKWLFETFGPLYLLLQSVMMEIYIYVKAGI